MPPLSQVLSSRSTEAARTSRERERPKECSRLNIYIRAESNMAEIVRPIKSLLSHIFNKGGHDLD